MVDDRGAAAVAKECAVGGPGGRPARGARRVRGAGGRRRSSAPPHRLLRSRGVPLGRRRPALVGAQRAATARCSPWTGPSGSSRVLAPSEAPMGIGEVAEMTGLPQGTAHRLLHSLQSRGYVRQDSSRKYSVGTAALRLGDAAQRSLARNARPHLSDLVAISGETANLAVLEGNDVVCVAQAPSPHTLRMFAEVGRHVPPHSTAVGKVLLAAMPRERALGLLRRTGLPRRTDQTITELGAFARELDTVLNHGWAADEEEQEVGVRCLAVPVGHGEDAVAAISLSGPAERFNGGREPGLVEAMGRVAQRFADELLGP